MPSDYQRIETAIDYLETRFRRQPDLDEVARSAGLSPYHFQRLFRRWAGVSPKRFVQFLTVEYAKGLLAESRSVLDAALESGLSGPGRLHDHFVSLEAITPGEFKTGGAGLTIRHGTHPGPFGKMLVGVTDRGLCALSFLTDRPADEELARLRDRWPGARVVRDPAGTRPWAERVAAGGSDGGRLDLFVQGTNFQVQVWKALLAIPPGYACTYERVARAVGRPGASRAVGRAVGANPVGYLIPCHRVIRSVGLPGGYRWGETRKRAVLAWEAAHRRGEAA